MASFCVFVIVIAINGGYVNHWDQEFNFKCPAGQTLSYISSILHNFYEDRRWEFSGFIFRLCIIIENINMDQ
jgi:Dermatopontin